MKNVNRMPYIYLDTRTKKKQTDCNLNALIFFILFALDNYATNHCRTTFVVQANKIFFECFIKI